MAPSFRVFRHPFQWNPAPPKDRTSLIPHWLILLGGLGLGQSQLWTLTLDALERHASTILVPGYAICVVLYLFFVANRRLLGSVEKWFRPKSGSSTSPKEVPPQPLPLLEDTANDDQPFNLSGAFKLISNEGFDDFLAVQGIPWAIRRAANQARPVHRIFHRGNQLTIKIEGIIESQTTYIIGGPPVETNVRGRIFEDKVTYLETGTGILVSKTSLTEDYDVTVQRELSDDRQRIYMTSTAYFRDDRDDIESKQVFQRIE